MTQEPARLLSEPDLADLFDAHHAALQHFLGRHVGCPDIAADLAQEAYVRFLRRPDRDRIADPAAFLFTIAANLSRDHFRRRARQRSREHVPLDPALPDPKPSPESDLEGEQETRILEGAIESLPSRAREVFLLYRAGDWSYRDIATRLGISPRTVEYHIRQALIHCRRHVHAAGFRD
ncbi:MAG: RNA polymerase sigma factor [Gammaproteobacteria bacterium]